MKFIHPTSQNHVIDIVDIPDNEAWKYDAPIHAIEFNNNTPLQDWEIEAAKQAFPDSPIFVSVLDKTRTYVIASRELI